MKSWSYILLLLALFISCTPRVEVDYRMTEGYIDMACDETFANVIEQHAYVYTRTYPGAFISVQPTHERAVLQALLDDSVRLVAMTRRLTEAEKNKILVDNRLNCNETHIAVDAMALVTNRNNPDSVLTVDMVRRILTGEVTRWEELFPGSKLGKIQVIFDNRNSSIVRYAIDSICAPAPLYNGVSAVENTMQVVEEVAARRNAIGLIGARERIILILCKACENNVR